MNNRNIQQTIKKTTSWKVQLTTSLLVGCLFGFYHFLLSQNDLLIFTYYCLNTALLSMGLWQVAHLTFRLTDKKMSWFEMPYTRMATSFSLGFVFTYCVVFITDYILPLLVDPLFNFDSIKQREQPEMNVATFFLDGAICIFIFLFYLTYINLFSYFKALQAKREKDLELSLEHYFESLIENIHDVIQVIDAKGSIIFCSSSIKALTGFSIDEVNQLENGFALIHPEDKPRIFNEFKQKAGEGISSYSTRYAILTKDGAFKQVETKVVNALDNPRIKGFICVNSDVTERLKAEEKSKHQKELYQLLTNVSTSFLDSDLLNSVQLMLEKIGRFAGVDRSYIYLLDDKETIWNCLHEWRSYGAEDITSNFYESGLPVRNSQWLYQQIKSNSTINYEDTNQIPSEARDFKDICKKDNTQSVLLLPILRNEKVYGFMGFDSVLNKKKWQNEDVAMLQICSEILISSILRIEAENETQKSLSVNKAIVDSTSEGILLTDLDDNILYYNQNFTDMWLIPDEILNEGKKSIALNHAIKNVINAEEIYQIISTSEEDVNKRIRLVAHMKNKRVLEGISQPQIIDGKVVGRVWSNRDITERIHAEKEEIEKGIAQAQFESLKNQVNPHFLFNSLNVLSSLVHIDPTLSEKFIDQLARSYRYLLEQKDNELVLLKTEIDFVQSFTFLLKIRFEEKLQVNIKLSAGIMQYYVAPLTLQLLIENAVKHNIISTESPLIIDIYNEGDRYLVVSNNLQIREQQLPSTGVGLKNIKDRYKLLTQTPTEFNIENNKYIAKVPLLKNNVS